MGEDFWEHSLNTNSWGPGLSPEEQRFQDGCLKWTALSFYTLIAVGLCIGEVNSCMYQRHKAEEKEKEQLERVLKTNQEPTRESTLEYRSGGRGKKDWRDHYIFTKDLKK